MYFEFLFRRAHSRRRVERMYWSGVSLYSFTTISKDVMVGTTGPMGSGLPQLGLPRRFAMNSFLALPAANRRNTSFYHFWPVITPSDLAERRKGRREWKAGADALRGGRLFRIATLLYAPKRMPIRGTAGFEPTPTARFTRGAQTAGDLGKPYKRPGWTKTNCGRKRGVEGKEDR